MNVYALALGVELIARGMRADSVTRANFGLLVIAALAVARFFDSDVSFVTRAIGFIVIGVGFLRRQSLSLPQTSRDMKTLRIAIFIVVALVQIAAPASMIWKRAAHFSRRSRLEISHRAGRSGRCLARTISWRCVFKPKNFRGPVRCQMCRPPM